MIWPLYYATTVAVLFAATRFRYRWALPLCLLARRRCRPWTSRRWRTMCSDLRAFGFRNPLESRFWNVAAPHYRQLVLVPSNLCTRDGFVDYSAFSLLAGHHGLGINAGITARYDVKKSRAYCDELAQEVQEGMRGSGSLYIVRPDLLSRVAPRDGQAGAARCTVVDGFGVCFSPESHAQWRGEFDVVRSRLPAPRLSSQGSTTS